MFSCNNCGGCCEDPATQINLTLGDIQRISKYTDMTAVELYDKRIIGIYPFGDPFKDNEFETDVGLFIPCRFRLFDKNKKFKICDIYKARPINCRLFPYWVLAEAPMEEIDKFVNGHVCGKACHIDEDFQEDRKIYHEYKEHIVEILIEESKVTDPFYENLGLKKKLTTEHSKTKESDIKVIKELINKINNDGTRDIFQKIDQKLSSCNFKSYNDIKDFKDFIPEEEYEKKEKK